MKRDVAESVNFTLKLMDSKEWSRKEDYGLTQNIDIQSFTEINAKNLQGFSLDNYDIVDYQSAEDLHHLAMTDQV